MARSTFLEPLETRVLLAAQDATGVVAFSSQWSPGNYSANQATGAPNVATYGDSINAWAPAVNDGSTQSITLRYRTPYFADGITIYESLGAGSVTTVEVGNASGGTFTPVSTVFSGTDPTTASPGDPTPAFFIPFTKTTTQVNAARVTLNTGINPLWEEIDAVRLHGDPAAGITVTPTSGLVTDENGGTATFSVVLNSIPSDNVSVFLSTSDSTEGTTLPLQAVHFTPGNALTPQTVTVKGVDDGIVDGNVAYTIITSPAQSSDPNYNGLNPADVSVTNNDNDGVPLKQYASSVISATSMFSSQYAATNMLGAPNVFVYGDSTNAWSAATRDGTTEVVELGYTTPVFANGVIIRESWGNGFVTKVEVRNRSTGTYSTVFTGPDTSPKGVVHNFNVSFPQTTFLVDAVRLTIDTSADPNLWEQIDSVRLCGSTVGTPPGITVSPTVGTTTEAGGSTTFTVVLDTVPNSNVRIPISSSDISEGTVSPTTLTFTPANALTPQTVTVTGVDDTIVDGSVGYKAVTGPAISSDANYSGLNAADVNVVNEDDDGAPQVWLNANNVISFSTQFNSTSFSANQVLHEPNVFAYGDNPLAWSASTQDGTTEFLEVGFESPLFANGVTVRETWGSGSVTKVEIRNALTGVYTTVFSGVDPSPPGAIADAMFPFTQTTFPVDAARVTLNTSATGEWEEIDSIMLHGIFADSLSVNIAAASVLEDAGPAATTATITRMGSTANALTVTLTSDDTTEATVQPTVVIPAGSSSATVNVNAIDDSLLDGTQTVTISATAAAHVGGGDTVNVVDDDQAVLTVTIAAASVGEADGPAATTATVTRNSENSSALLVSLVSSDTTEATVTSNVIIPAGANSVAFNINAVDDAIADGTQNVTITASASLHLSGTDTLDVTDDDGALTLNILAASVVETAGAGATTATVTRNTSTASPLTVTLISSDVSEATVPVSVTIPAGSASATFNIAAVDDTILDGTQTVTVTASAGGHASGSDTLDVTDNEVATVAISIAAGSISEGAGAAATTGTVTRNTPTTSALTVALASNDTTEATVPATVVIPSGAASATFNINAVNDSLVDGTQTVTISASAAGHAGTSGTLNVTDDDPAALSLSIAASAVSEAAGAGATTATVTRNTGTSGALVVSLGSGDTTEASVPATVTIPNGSSSATFNIDAVDDTLLDGTQTAAISASAPGFVPASSALNVVDAETLSVSITVPIAAVAENAGAGAATGTVTRSNTDNGAPLTVILASNDTTEASVATSVTIPAGSASATFPINAVDDALLDGTQTATISAAATGYAGGSDTLDVTDWETLTLTIDKEFFAEDAGAGAATGTITRSNTDVGAALVVTLANSDTTEASVPTTVTIPAGSASATFSVAAVDDALLDGTQQATVSGSNASYQVSGSDSVHVTDAESLTVTIAAASVVETAGAAATTATVTRSNTDNSAPLTVSLSNSDGSEASIPSSVTIPAGAASVTFNIDAVDDLVVDGTQTVSITATPMTTSLFLGGTAGLGLLGGNENPAVAGGGSGGIGTGGLTYNSGTNQLSIDTRWGSANGFTDLSGPATAMHIHGLTASAAPGSFAENAGVTVGLSSMAGFTSSASAGSFIGTVSISEAIEAGLFAGRTYINVHTAANGPGEIRGNLLVSGYSSGSDTLDVTDNDVPTLTVSIATGSVSETAGSGATTATVTRNTDMSVPLTVTLASNDTTEATVQSTVVIPSGAAASAPFAINAVDDLLVDGTQTVTISASAAAHPTGSATLNVTDNDLPTLNLTIAASSISEAGGPAATTATVTRNSTTAAPLLVTIGSSDPSEAIGPAAGFVIIPGGLMSLTFPIDAVDDTIFDGTQTVTFGATAFGHTPASASVDVTDFESLTVTLTPGAVPETAGAGAATGTVTRSNTDSLGALVVSLTSNDTTEATVPSIVTIPAGSASATFSVSVSDDNILDGTQTVSISASASSYSSVPGNLDVLDVEFLTVAIGPAFMLENAGAAAASATVTRSDTGGGDLTVTLSSLDTTEATVPATVVIPSGSASASFSINAVDDALLDGTQTVTIAANASGYSGLPDTIDVVDVETISLSLSSSTVSEGAGTAATTGTVTRSDTADLSSAVTVGLASSDTTEATVPASVVIPAGSSTATFSVSAVEDTIVDGTQTVTLSSAASGFSASGTTLDVTDNDTPTLTVSITASSISESGGTAATTGTVTRNTSTASALTVTLTSNDTTEATVGSTVVIPAGSSSATFNIAATDDLIVDGTQTATISASAAGHTGGSSTVNVTDNDTPGLTLDVVATTIEEDDGAAATTATVTRNTDTTNALVVTLSSSDTSEASVPTSVIIPAGSASVSFNVAAVDDTILDGTQTVTIKGTAFAHTSGVDSVNVADVESLTVTLPTSASMSENSGTVIGTVTRNNTDTGSALTVLLGSGDTTEASVPTSVTISAGSTAATFTVSAVDDTLLDGTQTVAIIANASGYKETAQSNVDVTDDETLSVSISAASIKENAGAAATTGTVTRNNTDLGSSLVVTLASSDTTEATVPATVTIASGASTGVFNINAVDDALFDGTQTVTITASNAAYSNSPTATVDVTDVEDLSVVIGSDSFAENAGTTAATGTVSRSDSGSAVTVTLTSNDTSEATLASTTVVIPSGSMSASFTLDAIDDALLDGTQTVTITATATSYDSGNDTVNVTDVETLSLSIGAASFAENAGTAAATGTVTRNNTDLGSAITVNLANNDTTEASLPSSTVVIPSGSSSATFSIDAKDDNSLDGTQTVTLSATAAGYSNTATDTVNVTDAETLSVSITAASIAEDAGANATTATVTRPNTELGTALTVTLTSDDTSEATVPSTIVIPISQSSVIFTVDAVDDTVLDGTQTVTVTATATSYLSGTDTVDVTDKETLTVSLAASSVAESAGAAATTGTLTRTNAGPALTITLSSSDTTEATLSATTVTFAAGSTTSSPFTVNAIDDTILDGTQGVSISATNGTGYTNVSGALDVTDDETLSLTLSGTFAETAGSGAATGTVTRNNTDLGSALTVTLVSGDTTEATVQPTVTIPAGSSSATFSVAAVDDNLLDGTVTVTITASHAGYSNSPTGTVSVTDVETLGITITEDSFAEDAGAAAATGTVSRSDSGAAATVTLSNSDTSEASLPATTVVIPSGSTSASFTINAVDDTLLDGTQTVTITATEASRSSASDTVNVTDAESLAVSITAAAVAETAGTAATTGTVTRSNTGNLGAALTVNLASNDTTEATVPATVVIPAGSSTAIFSIDAKDDALLDGTQTATVTASAAGYTSGTDTLDVTDVETLSLTIAADDIPENPVGPATSATVTRSNTNTGTDLTVTLTSDDTSEATVPSTVVIPSGSSSATFVISAVDDAALDGTQTVTVSASATGYSNTPSDTVNVTDVESLSITSISTISETATSSAPTSTTAAVVRSDTGGGALTVTLVSGDTTEATVPSTVTFSAGSTTSTPFTVTAVDDAIIDGTQTVTITASHASYVSGSNTVSVEDTDTASLSIDMPASFAESAGTNAGTGTVSHNDLTSGTAVTVTLSNSDASELSVPATVTIPAGSTSTTFTVGAVDDTVLDGTQTVTVTASAAGHAGASDTTSVTDFETLSVSIAADSIAENAGTAATTGTVTRNNTDLGSPLTVTLANSDTTEASLPVTTVVIPSGSSSATFTLDAVDDAVADGTQTVTITASNAAYISGTDTVNVTDNDVATLTVDISALTISEAGGLSVATVTRNSDTSVALLVSLSSNDTTEATVDSSVVIPSGSTSATFLVTAVDDTLADGTQTVTVTAAAFAHTSGSDTINVTSNELFLDTEGLTVERSAANSDPLTEAELREALDDAVKFWAAEGISADQLAQVSQADVEVVDYSGDLLGEAFFGENGRIALDRDAAGYGWSVIDLHSVVTHELGHLLGFDHDSDAHGGVLAATLQVDDHHHDDDHAPQSSAGLLSLEGLQSSRLVLSSHASLSTELSGLTDQPIAAQRESLLDFALNDYVSEDNNRDSLSNGLLHELSSRLRIEDLDQDDDLLNDAALAELLPAFGDSDEQLQDADTGREAQVKRQPRQEAAARTAQNRDQVEEQKMLRRLAEHVDGEDAQVGDESDTETDEETS